MSPKTKEVLSSAAKSETHVSYAVCGNSVYRYENHVKGPVWFTSKNVSYCNGVARFLNERSQAQNRNTANEVGTLTMTSCPTCKRKFRAK